MNHENISVRFPYPFLTYTLGQFDFIEIELEDALVIEQKDKQQNFCHVEFPSSENLLRKPRLWAIKPWRTSYEKWQKDKERSAKERHEANLRAENTTLLAAAISRQLGLSRELVTGIASKIASRKDTKAAENWKVKIEV